MSGGSLQEKEIRKMATVSSQIGLCAKCHKKEGKRHSREKIEKTPNISFVTISVWKCLETIFLE